MYYPNDELLMNVHFYQGWLISYLQDLLIFTDSLFDLNMEWGTEAQERRKHGSSYFSHYKAQIKARLAYVMISYWEPETYSVPIYKYHEAVLCMSW